VNHDVQNATRQGWRCSHAIRRSPSHRWRDTCSGDALLLNWSLGMLDLVFIAATVGLFAAAFGYARACARV
jgi:hypothetical protein